MAAQAELLLETFDRKAESGGVTHLDFRFSHPKYPDLYFYRAGIPGYLLHFNRDSLTTGLLSGNKDILENTLKVAAVTQSRKIDPRTGGRVGAIAHEFDPETEDGMERFEVPGITTLYNASDTNALYLISHERLTHLTGSRKLCDEQIENIELATDFILSQVNDSFFFVENPAFCGADRYSLAVTYWKDSKLPQREGGLPVGDVIIPLLHFQNASGLRSAARLLNSKELSEVAENMVRSGISLFDESIGNFPIAIDDLGKVNGISSDGLHALCYLEPNDIPREILLEILKSSRILETEVGYRALDAVTAKTTDDPYHTDTVWHHEQSIIAEGLMSNLELAIQRKDKELIKELKRAIYVTTRNEFLILSQGKYREISYVTDEGMLDRERISRGNDHQFWVWGAFVAKERINKKLLELSLDGIV